MKTEFAGLKTKSRLLPSVAALTLAMSSVIFPSAFRIYVLTGFMLFFPLLDPRWRLPVLPLQRSSITAWVILGIVIIALLVWQPQHVEFTVYTLLLAALPEEWFFRAYFMERLGKGFRANLITSLLFALVHGLARDWTTGLLVFTPSLFYGWLYQSTRNLPLLVLVHALSNLIYAMFLAEFITVFLGNLR